MRSEQVYSVVDIEATGGSIGADERIIQFACVLIQNGETIHSFETLVNPGRNVPRKITQLTNISTKDVKKAPYFEEIAPIIISLLQDTIFIAHNVGFDYRFLNEQLKLHGFDEIQISAIDTVELTQILYPSLDSFQLEDIAATLGYDLINAHDALADAEATAYIFKALYNRAVSLPLVTLEKLNELAICTTHETYLLFQDALAQAYSIKEPLDEDLIVIQQIAIQRPEKNLKYSTSDSSYSYPDTLIKKEQYFNKTFQYQKTQVEMMDLIYNYLKEDLSLEKLAIEAPAGIGKSLGYLFPAIFNVIENVNKEPIVISTQTNLLQDQLLNETIPQMETILNRNIFAVLVKSNKHYISLDIFSRWLQLITAEDSEAYLSMRILVWLTETTTGDLSEINAGSHLDLDFWNEIRANKNQWINNHWREFEFYERIKQSLKYAEIIITNHHFLVNDWRKETSVIPQLNKLIVDEAHHFPQVAIQNNTTHLKGQEITKQLEKLGSMSNNTKVFKLINLLVENSFIKEHEAKALERTKNILLDNWNNLFNDVVEQFHQKQLSRSPGTDFVEYEIDLNSLSFNQKKLLKMILLNAEEFVHVGQEISNLNKHQLKNLNTDSQLSLIELKETIQFVHLWHKKLKEILEFIHEESAILQWVSYLPDNIENTFQINSLRWGSKNSFIDYIATHSKVIFTSSTLSFQNSESYFSDELKNLPMKFYQFQGPFDYQNQTRVFVSDDKINPKKISFDEYPKALAKSISSILNETNANTLILFRSFATLDEVYKLLLKDKQMLDYLILAQSISGTRNRIIKNFKRNKPAVILGVDSFFEGIDLPNEELELIILTRLPFPAPNTPIMRLKTAHLKDEGVDLFMGEILPQAVLKFKQAFGRLIRNKNDRGALVILDHRFLSASYAKVFQDALPKNILIDIEENQQIGKRIEVFRRQNNILKNNEE